MISAVSCSNISYALKSLSIRCLTYEQLSNNEYSMLLIVSVLDWSAFCNIALLNENIVLLAVCHVFNVIRFFI